MEQGSYEADQMADQKYCARHVLQWMTSIVSCSMLMMVLSNSLVECTEETFVDILNYVGTDPIFVHCRSKDTDLGMMQIDPGEDYMFKFMPNFFGSTSFWCEFIWKSLTQDFNVWRGEDYMDRMPCAVTGSCAYKVSPEGFYWSSTLLAADDEGWTFWKNWES